MLHSQFIIYFLALDMSSGLDHRHKKALQESQCSFSCNSMTFVVAYLRTQVCPLQSITDRLLVQDQRAVNDGEGGSAVAGKESYYYSCCYNKLVYKTNYQTYSLGRLQLIRFTTTITNTCKWLQVYTSHKQSCYLKNNVWWHSYSTDIKCKITIIVILVLSKD